MGQRTDDQNAVFDYQEFRVLEDERDWLLEQEIKDIRRLNMAFDDLLDRLDQYTEDILTKFDEDHEKLENLIQRAVFDHKNV